MHRFLKFAKGFPLAIIALSIYAHKHLKILQNRFLLIVTHLLKLEGILGLHKDITNILPHFKEDKYLFPKYRAKLEISTDKFIENEMDTGKSAFKLMGHIYWITTIIAIGLVIFDLVIIGLDWINTENQVFSEYI